MDEKINEINHALDHRYEIKGSYDPCSYDHNLSNSVEKPEKLRVATGFSLDTIAKIAFITATIIASLDFISTVHYMIDFLYHVFH